MDNKEQDKKIVLSGMRATGRLHLGNYLGAIKGMLELQEDPNYETNYMVADVHAITTPYDPKELLDSRYEVVLDYLAAGLDPQKATIFYQSMIPQHLEFAFYLSSLVSVARMQHLPTFKDKVKQHPQGVTMALLNYPVLMASDILLYKAHEVPVGEDQEPHLEITRQIARKLNEDFGLDFPEPITHKTVGSYVPSLLGEGKMSKSVDGSYINISDGLETIKARLAKVPTDSGQGAEVPKEGSVANLLQFVELFMGEGSRKEYEENYLSSGIRYSELKENLAFAISKELEPIQHKRTELEKDKEYVKKVLLEGAEKARDKTQKVLDEVKQKMGFLNNDIV